MRTAVTPGGASHETRTPFVDELPSTLAPRSQVIPIRMEAEPEAFAPELESFADGPLEATAYEPYPGEHATPEVEPAEHEQGLLRGESPRAGASARPYEFYVTFQRAKGGPLKGESTRREHANKIVGIGFEYQITSPRDVATGAVTGRRRHGPVRLTKPWGAASPQLFEALASNRVFDTVKFEFVRADARSGRDTPFETITLSNASVVEMKRYSTSDRREIEEVALTFQQIEIESHPGKTHALNDWSVGEVAFEERPVAVAGSAYEGEPIEEEPGRGADAP